MDVAILRHTAASLSRQLRPFFDTPQPVETAAAFFDTLLPFFDTLQPFFDGLSRQLWPASTAASSSK
jgi:hypothetical protein